MNLVGSLGLACLVGALRVSGGEAFDPWTQAAAYSIEYRVDLSEIAASQGDTVEVWLPLPADGGAQRVDSLRVDSRWTHRETRDGRGNRFVYCRRGPGESVKGELVVRSDVRRVPDSGTPPSEVAAGSVNDPARYRRAQRRVPTDGRIRELASRAFRTSKASSGKIRALYDYVIATMRYSKEGSGWGRGDAAWACDTKYGNCTDFHSVLIGMARSQSIPARFVIGFPIPEGRSSGKVEGYHCWAELYDRDRGWTPVDASEAWKSKRPDAFFAKLPANRIAFTMGRDLVLDPPQRGEPLNFFVYPYAEVNGHAVETPAWELRFSRHSEAVPRG